MKRISIHLLIVFVLFLQSCIKEGYTTCEIELLLRFRYTLNDQNTNLFDSDIHRVTVYIFDSNGKYVETFSQQGDKLTNDYVMRIPLPEGKYSVVAYGGDFATYSAGELNAGTINPTLIKGVTDINDFRAELKNIIGVDNYLYPITTPDDLYAGLALNAISARANEAITDVELIRDTKKNKGQNNRNRCL